MRSAPDGVIVFLAKEAWNKAKDAGVFDGTAPGAPLTREQAALILERLGLLGK